MKIIIIICRVLFVVTGGLGFIDFGQGNFCEIIAKIFECSYTNAALIVSAMVGTFGALSLFPLKKT